MRDFVFLFLCVVGSVGKGASARCPDEFGQLPGKQIIVGDHALSLSSPHHCHQNIVLGDISSSEIASFLCSSRAVNQGPSMRVPTSQKAFNYKSLGSGLDNIFICNLRNAFGPYSTELDPPIFLIYSYLYMNLMLGSLYDSYMICFMKISNALFLSVFLYFLFLFFAIACLYIGFVYVDLFENISRFI